MRRRTASRDDPTQTIGVPCDRGTSACRDAQADSEESNAPVSASAGQLCRFSWGPICWSSDPSRGWVRMPATMLRDGGRSIAQPLGSKVTDWTHSAEARKLRSDRHARGKWLVRFLRLQCAFAGSSVDRTGHNRKSRPSSDASIGSKNWTLSQPAIAYSGHNRRRRLACSWRLRPRASKTAGLTRCRAVPGAFGVGPNRPCPRTIRHKPSGRRLYRSG